MGIFQRPAITPEEVEASKPLEIAPEEVLELDEAEWYARVYRRDAPQLTLRALLMGSVLGFFLAFTNVYIGLKTGWFLGVNLAATLLSYSLWASLQRAGIAKSPMSILEQTTAVSTASSAGYATGNVVVSAIPAMLLLSVTEANPGGTRLAWWIMAPWVFFLGALGVVLAIPMKRGMINHERLKFPAGTAAAVTLQGLYSRGSEAVAKARVLFATAIFSGLTPLLESLAVKKVSVDPRTGATLREGLLPAQSSAFDWLTGVLSESWSHRMLSAGPAALHPNGAPFRLSDYQIKLDHGFALVFAGVLVGVRIAGWMLVGSLLLALLVTPHALDALATNHAGVTLAAATSPASAWKEIGIWIGAPLIVASGLVQFAARWRTFVRVLAGLLPRRGATRPADGSPRTDDVEVPGRWFVSGLLFAGSGVVLVAWLAFEIPIHLGILAVVMTFVLAGVACRVTGESDVTPASVLGKITQLTYGVLIPQSTTANLQTGAITAGAAIASADLLTDLKCGYLLGANPRRQFLAQAAGVLTGTIATVLCYFVLVPNAAALTGTVTKAPAFAAPGAQLWKAVAEVLKYGVADLHPMARSGMIWGLVVGVVLGLAELAVPKEHKRWVPSPTGLGLGMVLPFFYPLAMFLGALFGEIATAVNETWAERYLVPIAAGGIAGESIVGVVVQATNNFVLG